MNLARNILVRILYTVLPVVLFGFGFAWSLYMVLGTPQPLERALHESGIYSNVLQNSLEEQRSTMTGLPVQHSEIQSIVQKSFPPDMIEENTNKVLDSTYAWIRGDSKTLDFMVDLRDAKAQLASNVESYVLQRSASLPLCPPYAVPSTDPYTAACRPAQVASAAIAAQAKQEVSASDFLKDGVITANTITNSEGKTLAQQLESVPQSYAWMKRMLFGSGILALVVAAGILVLRRGEWRQALKRLGIVLIVIGTVSAAIAGVSSYILSDITQKMVASDTHQLLQTNIVAAIESLVRDLRTWWMGYGIALIILGMASIITEYYLKRGTSQKAVSPIRKSKIDFPAKK